jgi:hypothetical protein
VPPRGQSRRNVRYRRTLDPGIAQPVAPLQSRPPLHRVTPGYTFTSRYSNVLTHQPQRECRTRPRGKSAIIAILSLDSCHCGVSPITGDSRYCREFLANSTPSQFHDRGYHNLSV